MLTFLTLHQVRLRAGADVESTLSAIGARLEVVPGYVPVGVPTALRKGRTESLIAWVLPLVGSRLNPGSGADFHETREWWAYSGILNRPRVTATRGACARGRRGTARYPIDWEVADAASIYEPVIEGPQEDWERHLDEAEARTVRPSCGKARIRTARRSSGSPGISSGWPVV
ncbi:hypothetical protein [Streptomyces sp. NPDC054797]